MSKKSFIRKIFSRKKNIQQEDDTIKQYRLAAEKGDADAQYELGVCYWHGKGVNRDDAQAAKWFRKAANQGHADVQM